MKKFLFTCGDPNGIGPETVIKTLNSVNSGKYQFVFIIPQKVFELNAKFIDIKFRYSVVQSENELPQKKTGVFLLNINGGKISPGKPTKTSGRISHLSLLTALDLIKQGNGDALITAPISKETWDLSGVKYKGHTDLLGDYFGVEDYAMMFYSSKMIAALTTIHVPFKNVSSLIKKDKLTALIKVVNDSLRIDLKIKNPELAVLGLNPHAGEEGRLGSEENEIIKPAIKSLKNINVWGPFVPDAFFGRNLYKEYNAVIGMYHDQVLIPFKLLSFDSGVNYTAGLPVVRTSPDHGTAFDIAYKGIANYKSTLKSYELAAKIVSNRREYYRE